MNIVFSINKFGLTGLGATLVSLIRNCSNNADLALVFLCSDINTHDKQNIKNLLVNENFTGRAKFIDFDAKKEFGHLKALHGDYTCYGRLLIPKLLPSEDQALYLDADLLVLLDVLELKEFNFNEKILAAVYGSTITYTLDKRFFLDKLKWKDTTAYFNSGVILFNLKQWRIYNINAKVKALIEKYPLDLTSHDQTLLNAVSNGQFERLPSKFNTAWLPGKNQAHNLEDKIIHFIGSPKPWDMVGKIIHNGYRSWLGYTTKNWKKKYCKTNINKLKRAWKIRRSIIKKLK
ncbi:glycosyltransferase family 8 protein [Neotamlana laminarinivorans]|uniref:Lipopolysaccharide biosynthesis glycosyltransferase n=1 Tax=Neotamlana laminarinivorans TaxID=2883124 RepID=A0A9X1I2C6_9FLAO|nr:glycosyltransferase [Tamlana laminarinivorans]MCB4799012.1 hypothetical protein [Tamlana laminarinivorans]